MTIPTSTALTNHQPIHWSLIAQPALDMRRSGLSPEGMIAMFQTQIERLDGEIDGLFSKMNSQQKQTEVLNTVLIVAQKSRSIGDDGDVFAKSDSFGELERALEKAKADLPDSSPARLRIDSALATLRSANPDDASPGHVDQYVSETEMNSIRSALESAKTDIGADSQQMMIKLQSFVSQKQQFISLFSNMLQTDHQASMAAINNIRGG